MNRIDTLILGGAALMAVTAGGLWVSHNYYIERPLAGVPVFEPDGEKAERQRTARFVKMDSGDGAEDRLAVRRAFLSAAKRLRVSPCSAPAKAAYIEAMSGYIGLKLADVRRAGDDRRWETPLDYQVIEYLDRMSQDNFITQADYRAAMKASTPALAMTLQAAEARGETIEMPTFGASACEAHMKGDRAPPMSWEPQPRAVDSPRMSNATRRSQRESRSAHAAADTAARAADTADRAAESATAAARAAAAR